MTTESKRAHIDGFVVHPWPPIANPDAKVLILGTMPSPASLRDGFYYGHPRNAFWDIMGALYDFERETSPDGRSIEMMRHKIAVWDVLKSCVRPGALDSSITDEEPNDFEKFSREHPQVQSVVFNGKAARNIFVKHHREGKNLGAMQFFFVAPSTSPAHAIPFDEKLKAWRRTMEAAFA